ncbi:MAG: hypothetical protein AXW15_13705 [Neptuniibacter sp. Phe_28]|nr:MAG: hypothetical protein AXW15_13705 [Neptuniibacter sp. Phe_28]
MAGLTMKIEVQNLDKIKTLIELLSRYQNELPPDLVTALHDLADSKIIELGVDDFQKMANGYEIETDFPTSSIVSVNHVLNRVTYLDSFGKFAVAFPDKFKLGIPGKTIISWGNE